MVNVKVYRRIKDDRGFMLSKELLQEFNTVRDAAVYINDIAEAKLDRGFSYTYISNVISGRKRWVTSFFILIDIITERSNKCVDCGCKFYSNGAFSLCNDCFFNRANFDN